MKNNSLLNLIIIISMLYYSSPKKNKNKDEKKELEAPEFQIGYITLPFSLSQINIPISQVKIGHPKQEISLVLDIGSMRTWVSDQYYKSSESDTYSTTNDLESYHQYDFFYGGVSSTETFKVGDKKLEQFKFLLVNNLQNNNFQGVLSLGHEFDSKHKSLVYEMSHVSNTFYNMFMFKFNENNGR